MKAIALIFLLPFLSCHQEGSRTSETQQEEPIHTNIAAPDSSRLILPGKAIGPMRIHQNSADIIKLFGQPDSSDAAMGKALLVWFRKHDLATDEIMLYTERQMGVDEISRIQLIRVTSPFYTTSEGIRAGSVWREVNFVFHPVLAGTFRKQDDQFSLYTSAGIAFEFDNDSICKAVIVADTSRSVLTTYLPLFPDLRPVE